MHLGSTPPALPYIGGAVASLQILEREPERLLRLKINVNAVREKLRALGWIHPSALGASIGIIPRGPSDQEQIVRRLLDNRIYPCLVRYPGGPDSGYFRLAISSEHTAEELARLLAALAP